MGWDHDDIFLGMYVFFLPRVFTLSVVIGIFHGLVFFPVVLGLCGRSRNKCEEQGGGYSVL